VRAAIDAVRRRRSRPIEVELTPLDRPVPGDLASGIADREVVDAALRRLDPESRALVVLHYFLGMSLPEAAAALRIPLGTAKSRLHRSLAAMRSTIVSETQPETSSLVRGRLA
jgi:RNA polymerase sigma-70 factor (ECF subfamily)